MRTKGYLLFLFCALSLFCKGEETPTCEAYPDFYPQAFCWNDTLHYTLFAYHQHMEIPADSVWITEGKEGGELVMVIHAQQNEKVPLTSLKKGYYACYMQLGECVGIDLIYVRGLHPEEAIDNTQAEHPAAHKTLRDGQLLIERGDKVYTVQGTEVR